MGPSCTFLVAVAFISVVMDTCGVGQDVFASEEAESSSYDFLPNSREILRLIASDSSASAIFFFCIAH